MNIVDNALPPGAPFKSTEGNPRPRFQNQQGTPVKTDPNPNPGPATPGLAGKIFLVPADKKHPPVEFTDMPAAKEMLAFLYKRASVRFNFNEIYAKVVNYKFEAKEKALQAAERAQAAEDRRLYDEDEL